MYMDFFFFFFSKKVAETQSRAAVFVAQHYILGSLTVATTVTKQHQKICT